MVSTGEAVMKYLDPAIRLFVLVQGCGVRWLRDELRALGVRVLLSDGCVAELTRYADGVARSKARQGGASYLSHFRQQLAAAAQFVHVWTGSDQQVGKNDPSFAELVRIARNYALPRPWRLSEPQAPACREAAFSHWCWASGFERTPLPQN